MGIYAYDLGFYRYEEAVFDLYLCFGDLIGDIYTEKMIHELCYRQARQAMNKYHDYTKAANALNKLIEYAEQSNICRKAYRLAARIDVLYIAIVSKFYKERES